MSKNRKIDFWYMKVSSKKLMMPIFVYQAVTKSLAEFQRYNFELIAQGIFCFVQNC